MVKVLRNEVSATSDKLVLKLQREIQYLKSLLNLRRKGGIQKIEQELWTLKEENEKLREISGMVTAEEVEKLRDENKKLRVELQKVNKGPTALGSSGSYGFLGRDNIETGSKPSTAIEIMSTPDHAAVRSSYQDREQPQAQDLYEIVLRKGADLHETLDAIRKHELQVAGTNLRRKILGEGRCPICTLKIPCKHYPDHVSLPSSLDPGSNLPQSGGIILNISSISDRDSHMLPHLHGRKESSQSNPMHFYTPKPPKFRDQSDEGRALSYRYRGPNRMTKNNPGKLIEIRQAENRKSALKEAEKKLNLLEKLERFREEKLRKEILKLEEEKAAEELEAQRDKEKEEKRQQYLQQQKQKLLAYEMERHRQESEQKQKALLDESKRKRADKRAKKHRELQRKKIEEYHQKKRMMEGIVSDQVQDLGKR